MADCVVAGERKTEDASINKSQSSQDTPMDTLYTLVNAEELRSEDTGAPSFLCPIRHAGQNRLAAPNLLNDRDAEANEWKRQTAYNILKGVDTENPQSTEVPVIICPLPRAELTQRAFLNILDDFDTEKSHLERTQKATFNILEDFNAEKLRLEDTQRAVLNILEDSDIEKSQLERTQKATFNILDDFNAEKLRLEDTQRALINILEDLNQSNEDLQRSSDILETRVVERTAELQLSNKQLREEMEERKRAEEALRRRTEELARSNAELEQFAYISSHDLQEPLRMISSYVQLLERRYKGKLDKDADDFIGYAADGAFRMQQLINDLLAYSRVGTRGKRFELVSLETALSRAQEHLQLAIKDKNAVITHDPLPMVYGDIGQLTQVFQNLIDNAIKFHGDAPPRVHISARNQEGECTCAVTDNGIGIASEFLIKLFVLFQRLHTRKEYPGTGLGLAICKRIVERHGGKIWVKSQPGVGSTFYFTIKTGQRSYYDGQNSGESN